MNIIDEIENRYRSMRGYGVQFSIDADAYSYDGPEKVSFGKNETVMQGGVLYNFQPVIINGETFGYLQESKNGKLFDPMQTSFCYIIADCSDVDYDDVLKVYKDNPHFCEDECLELRFATLNQFMEFYKTRN